MKKVLDIGICSAIVVTEAFSGTAHAACSSTAPTTGTSVVCTGTGILPVAAVAGSSAVTVGIDSTVAATLSRVSAPVAFSVGRASTIANSGALTFTGGGGSGTNRGAVLLGTGDANQLTNTSTGKITTTGAFNDGMAANGSGNTLMNNGSIVTSGPNAYGMTAAWATSISPKCRPARST
jgi:hypothetical protein